MSTAGRPKALDPDKQSTVCSLVAGGASLRQAASVVDCDPNSIRREAERNDKFRRQLAKAKSEANLQPLETLRQAAKDDWRAALHWMERRDPERFARHNATVVTQREANQFVTDLLETIERAVSDDGERNDLYLLLSAAMPAAMRRRWDARRVRRDIERAKHIRDLRKWKEDQRKHAEREKRDERRRKLYCEIKPYLPNELRHKLSLNTDLLDPEEVLAQRPDESAHRTCTPPEPHHDARANCTPPNDVPTNGGPTVDALANVGPTNGGPTNIASPREDFASPKEDFASPPRRNSENIANPLQPNDLPPRAEANSPE